MFNRSWTAALVGALVGGAGLASSSAATWSIIIVDTRTGEVAVASATCLTGFDLQANTPVLITGVGAATAQSFVDANGANRTYIRDRLLAGDAMGAILAGLEARDTGHQTRQYGIADVRGGALTFSGTRAGLWAGGRTGRVGDLVYAVQGNVLTGSPVVDDAVRAIETTPGDVAAKLMAAMEAARAMGGDGRCSCNPNDADGCGAPPPSFEKSAHIAYMLIARAGDAWDCRAAYRTQSGASDLLVMDADGDGRVDVLQGAVQAPAGLITLRARAGSVIAFDDAAITAAGGAVRGIAAADLDGDGVSEIVGANSASDRVVVLRRTGGVYAVAGTAAVGDNPVSVVAADFDRDGRRDVAVANTTGQSVSVLMGDGAGGLGAERRVALGAVPAGLVAGDFDEDGDTDLAVIHGGSVRTVVLIRNGPGGFAVETVRSGLSFAPAAIAARDLNGDGRADLVVGGGASVVVVTDVAAPASDVVLAAASGVNAIDLTDADGDGKLDLFAASGATLSLYRATASGFDTAVTFPMGFASSRIAARDLDGDGDVDVVYAGTAGTVVAMTNLAGPGRMPVFENAGCASGSGFMEFNVADQQAGDLDPVFQLRAMYDAWREGLERAADAVVSRAEWVPRGDVPVRANRTMRVTLRDWRGDVADAASVAVRRIGGVDADVGAVRNLGGGEFEIDVRAGLECGDATFEVRAVSAERTVVLMPSPVLQVGTVADANDDGFVDFFDYDQFVGWFESGDDRADLDGDGVVNPDDLAEFGRAFEGGC